jgi:hypothetical protein
MVDPILATATVLQGVRLISQIAAQLDAMNRGEMTAAEVQAQWAAAGLRVEDANAAWEAAEQRPI